MTWTKLDDAAPQHPKAKAAGNEAWCLWVAATVYSNRYLTDGVVSLGVLATECLPQPISLAKAKKLAEALCDVKQRPDGHGLFERIDKQFYRIHDFAQYNPTKAEVEARREVDRQRKRGGRGGGGPSEPPSGPTSGKPPGLPSGTEPDSERNPSGVPTPAGTHAGARAPVPSRPLPSDPDPAHPPVVSLEDRAKLWRDDPNRAQFQHPKPEAWPEILSLQGKLAEVFGHPVEQPRNATDPRCALPLRRYAEGYTEAQLLRAIEGSKKSRAIGESREYQTLATILRDAAQVDKLAGLAPDPSSSTMRKGRTIAEREAAELERTNADRVARGLRPLGGDDAAVRDPAEIDRLLAAVGNGGTA
jgi:hypothetical protein